MRRREQLVLLVYTLFNIIANHFIKFYSDETYYWLWSKKLDFSYFDHPPMVSYLIKLTTLFSDDPLFVRLGAALMVSGSAYILYILAKRMFDTKTAIYTFYIFISSFIVIAASTVIAPDIPLMFFASLLLYSAYMYLHEDEKLYSLLVGFAAGAMLLSKYTGILLIFTLVVYVLIYKREVFKDKFLYYAIAIAFLVFSPVLYWNYMNDFISFTFQLHHGMAAEKVFNLHDFTKFTSAQLVLFHPLYLLPLLYYIARDKERFDKKKVYLLLPFLFILLFFSYNSMFKHANAQWAGPAYVSASILLGYYMAKKNNKILLGVALALSTVVMLLIKTPLGLDVPPIKLFLSRLGKINNFQNEIKKLHLDMGSYNYIFIDDYHGSEVAYYFKKYKNVHVLSSARFSNFNLWRDRDLNISQESPVKTIPSLGKCLYIGHEMSHYKEIARLFHNQKILASFHKRVGDREVKYYFVEFKN